MSLDADPFKRLYPVYKVPTSRENSSESLLARLIVGAQRQPLSPSNKRGNAHHRHRDAAVRR